MLICVNFDFFFVMVLFSKVTGFTLIMYFEPLVFRFSLVLVALSVASELLEARTADIARGDQTTGTHGDYSLRFLQGRRADGNQLSDSVVSKLGRPHDWSPPSYNCTSSINRHGLSVNCSYQNISDISSLRLEHPERINQLLLTGNLIDNIPNGTWSPFVNLTSLSLSRNLLSRLENDTFSGLSSLEMLHLEGNGLTMSRQNFPLDVFKPLQNLKQLYMNNNTKINSRNALSSDEEEELAYPDWALASLTSLEKLYIDGLPNKDFGRGFKKMKSLRYLSMNGYNGPCSLGKLGRQMFENLGHLESLMMKRCGIRINHIDPHVLKPLQKLVHLDVSRNVEINLDGLSILLLGQLNSKTLTNLNVNMVVNPYSVSRCVSNILALNLPRSLRYLDAASNNLEIVEDKVFELLPKNLTYLNLNGNRFFFGNYVRNMWKMSNLKVLKLNGWIRGYNLPTYFTRHDQQPAFPCNLTTDKLEEISFFGKDNSEITLRLPPKLETLQMNLAELSLSITNFSIHPNNSLKKISVSGNNIPSLIGTVSGLHKLEFLDLSKNNIKYISPMFFYHSRLKTINLSWNDCASYLHSQQQSLSFPSSLRHLNLSYVPVKKFAIDFSTLKNLETLWLNNCNLQYFTPNMTEAENLRHLDLSENSLYTLSPAVTEAISNIPNLTVNISGNRIGCFCDNLPFINWLVHYPHLTDKNLSTLWCDKDGLVTEIKDFKLEALLLQRECATNLLLLSICTSVCASVLLLNFVFIAYRYRWKLRFWYYSAYFSLRSYDPQKGHREFESDVNIAYCKEDEDFAEETLNDALSNLGFRARISERDSSVGGCMFRDIVEAVQACRRTLVVLSPDMLACKWCQATVNLAAQEAHSSGRPALNFLVWRPVSSAHLGANLLFHIQNSQIFFYPPEESRVEERAMNLFWRKLARDLN